MKWKFHTALPASAMSYSLVVCLLIGTILSGMVLVFGLGKNLNQRHWSQEMARDNMHSGVALALYGDEVNQGKQPLFGSGGDSVQVEDDSWGLYGLVHSTGIHGRAEQSGWFLYGQTPEELFAANLFLMDLNKPLYVAGKTSLRGELYLPKAGIRRGRVGTKGYLNKHLHQGSIYNSSDKRIKLSTEKPGRFAEILKAIYSGGPFPLHRFIHPPESISLHPGDSLQASWDQAPKWLSNSGVFYLNDLTLTGKVIVTAPEIHISKNCRLDLALLYARSIYIEDGFSGRIQAFATDTLVAGRDCHFGYPSTLLVSNPEHQGLLVLGSSSQLEGMLIHRDAFLTDEIRKGGYTLIDTQSTVFGTVHVPFNLDLKGQVQGHVSTGNFQTRTPGSVYENHLVDAWIGPEGLSPNYAMGLIQAHSTHKRLIEALP